MDVLKLFCTAVGSFAVLFVLMRLNGKRQISQLSAFDYINGITIGSIAAEMATELEDFWKPLLAMVLYALLTLLVSVLTDKSRCFRYLATGKPQVLLEDGVFHRESFKGGHIDLDEFLSRSRLAGYFKVSDIKLAILEPCGDISFLPYDRCRPATPEDLGKAPTSSAAPIAVVGDGKILSERLSSAGISEKTVKEKLAAEKIDLSDVFLATCDENGELRIYLTACKCR